MKKANFISAFIAATAFAGFVYAHDYYYDTVAHFIKYLYQFAFFGIGLLVFDYFRIRKRKK